MERDKFDLELHKRLKDEVEDIKITSSLRDSILKNTIMKKRSPYERFKRAMNTTIEIPVPSAMAVCLVVFFFAFTVFRVTDVMKKDESIKGYTSVRTVEIGGVQVIVDKDWGVENEKNQD